MFKRKSYAICFKRKNKFIFSIVFCSCKNYHLCKLEENKPENMEIMDTFKTKEEAMTAFEKC